MGDGETPPNRSFFSFVEKIVKEKTDCGKMPLENVFSVCMFLVCDVYVCL